MHAERSKSETPHCLHQDLRLAIADPSLAQCSAAIWTLQSLQFRPHIDMHCCFELEVEATKGGTSLYQKHTFLSPVLIQTFGDMSMFIPVPQTCLL